MLTGDSTEKLKEDMSDPITLNNILVNTDLFIYTSCYKIGIDIQIDDFQEVFLIMDCIPNMSNCMSVPEFIQCCGRIRKRVCTHIFMRTPILVKDTPESIVYEHIIDNCKYMVYPNNNTINNNKHDNNIDTDSMNYDDDDDVNGCGYGDAVSHNNSDINDVEDNAVNHEYTYMEITRNYIYPIAYRKYG